MKTKVDDKAVLDLIHSIPRTAPFARIILRAVYSLLPLIEDGNEELAIQEALVNANSNLKQSKYGFCESEVRSCIRELDNYTDKKAVIEATLIRINLVCRNEEEIVKLRPAVIDTFVKMDRQTRELFFVFRYLQSVGSYTQSSFDFANDIFSAIDIGKPALLRTLPKFFSLVKAYDLAEPIIETM